MRPTPASPPGPSGLPRALLQAAKLSQQQIDTLQRDASNERTPFIDHLIRSGEMDAKALAMFCATHFGCPLLDLDALDIQALPKNIIDDRLMQSQRVVVLANRANKISVALADPTQTQALDQVKFRTGLSVEPVVVLLPQLTDLIAKLSQSAAQNLSELIGDDLDNVALVDDSNHSDTSASEIDDAPVVRFLQKILTDAINMGASDLHFEPFEKFYRIRFRIDGVLREISQPPLAIKEKLASRIKVISRLDISEKRVPQDGRMKLSVSGTRSIDFRVSTLPTLFGEKIVMRILDGSQAQLGIDALGYDPDQKALLLDAIHRP